jgi:hypothetical protein
MSVQDSATPQLFALLLRDAAALLRPSLIVEEADTRVGPHARALRVLGDLHALFRTRVHVAHKITFYAASLGGGSTKETAVELEREAEAREVELKVDKIEWERAKARKVEIVELKV